jgi:hypothetical protein
MTNWQDSRFARPQVARRVEHKDVRHEIQRLKDDVGSAVVVGRLELVADIARGCDRHSFL